MLNELQFKLLTNLVDKHKNKISELNKQIDSANDILKGIRIDETREKLEGIINDSLIDSDIKNDLLFLSIIDNKVNNKKSFRLMLQYTLTNRHDYLHGNISDLFDNLVNVFKDELDVRSFIAVLTETKIINFNRQFDVSKMLMVRNLMKSEYKIMIEYANNTMVIGTLTNHGVVHHINEDHPNIMTMKDGTRVDTSVDIVNTARIYLINKITNKHLLCSDRFQQMLWEYRKISNIIDEDMINFVEMKNGNNGNISYMADFKTDEQIYEKYLYSK